MKQSLRIAIADDESDVRQYFRRLLSRLGHQVVGEAENGQELVEICQTENPDLVITDVMMPEMNGLEAVAEIGKFKPIPAIVVSSLDPLLDYDQTQIVAFLVKPISIPELEAAVEKAIRQNPAV